MSEKTYSLLIWHRPPEEIAFYRIPNDTITATMHATLQIAHGHLENCDELTPQQREALDRINNIICDKPEYISERFRGTEYAGTFAQYQVDESLPVAGPISDVYYAGWVM